MTAHVAYMRQIGINALGQPVDKNVATTTLKDVMTASTELRVDYNPAIPSTGNPNANPPTTYPTIEEYITREAALGFQATVITNTMIVTYGT